MTITSYEFYKFELFEEAKQSFTKKKLLHEEVFTIEFFRSQKFWENCLVKHLDSKITELSSTKSSVVVDLTRSRRSLVNNELNQNIKRMLDCGMEKNFVYTLVEILIKKYSLREEDKDEIEVLGKN
jgi:hypothetical protein